MKDKTIAVHGGLEADKQNRVNTLPIFQTTAYTTNPSIKLILQSVYLGAAIEKSKNYTPLYACQPRLIDLIIHGVSRKEKR